VIVDGSNNCSIGSTIFQDQPELEFRTEKPDEYFNAAILDGVIQYLEGWNNFLSSLNGCDYLYIGRVPTIETVSISGEQLVILPCGQEIGTTKRWLINQKDIKDALRAGGFTVLEERLIRNGLSVGRPDGIPIYIKSFYCMRNQS
jgi:hypothetical protein